MNPFNTFDLDPPAWIDRPVELNLVLDGMLNSRDRMIVVQGDVATGKSTLSRQFVEHFGGEFPGGVDERRGRHAPELGNPRTPAKGRSLLVFDGLDEARVGIDATLSELRRLLYLDPSLHVLVTSRPVPQISHLPRVNLPPLGETDIVRLIMREAGTSIMPPRPIALAASGNPMIAAILGRMFRDKGDWASLVDSLRSFSQSGLVDTNGAPLGPDTRSTRKFITDVRVVDDGILQMIHAHPDLVFSLPPRRFEEICAEMFRRLGYDVTLTPPTKDGGKDLIVVKRSDLGTMLTFVECKRYDPGRPVGVEIVRALNGVVEEGRATSGMVLTSSRFTKGALLEQRKLQYRMSLNDYGHFKDLLRRAMQASSLD